MEAVYKGTENEFCRNCGARLPVGATFCNRCGSRVESISSDPKVCPNCGGKTEADWLYCYYCGSLLKKDTNSGPVTDTVSEEPPKDLSGDGKNSGKIISNFRTSSHSAPDYPVEADKETMPAPGNMLEGSMFKQAGDL